MQLIMHECISILIVSLQTKKKTNKKYLIQIIIER